MSVNKVILIGRVGKDPEIRATQSGASVASFSLATSEKWKDKNSGEQREKTEWTNVVVFSEGLVKVVESYVKKGSQLYIEGKLQTRKWQDKSGNDRYSTEVVLQGFGGTLQMLDGKSGNIDKHSEDKGDGYQPQPDIAVEELDDEIPF